MEFKLQHILVLILCIIFSSQQNCVNTTSDFIQFSKLPGYQADPNLCSYSGQIDITPQLNGSQTIFYWYFFNDSAPNLPVMIWLQGGPGSSGMFGLFKEEGPLQFVYEQNQASNNTNDFQIYIKDRKNSWLQYAHLIFVDQPRGTGFSFSNAFNYNENQTAEQFEVFLDRFVQIHSNIKNLDWFVYGESYGGKYAPYITRQLLQSKKLNIKAMAMIDPLIFGGVQKSSSRNQVYAGLNIMSPLEISQYNTLQQGCAFGIYTNISNQTKYCTKAENYMSNQTSNIDLQDVRFFDDSEGMNLIDYYFNQQDEPTQLTIIQTLHLDLNSSFPTPKQPPIIFKSQPQVYDTFAKSNDIYGDNTQEIVRKIAEQIPVMIIEGIYDTMDGVLPVEFYKEFITNGKLCEPRVQIQMKDKGQCIVKGFTQNCSNSEIDLILVGVWNAGHMVPYNQLEVSNYLVQNFIKNSSSYCQNGCSCNLNRSQALNNCSGNGIYVQNKSNIQCKCNSPFVLGDCSAQAQIVQLNQSQSQLQVQVNLCQMNYYILNVSLDQGSPFKIQLSLNKYNQHNDFYFSLYSQFQGEGVLPLINFYNTSTAGIIINESVVIQLAIRNQKCNFNSNTVQNQFNNENNNLIINFVNTQPDNTQAILENQQIDKQQKNDIILISCSAVSLLVGALLLFFTIKKIQSLKKQKLPEQQPLFDNQNLPSNITSQN